MCNGIILIYLTCVNKIKLCKTVLDEYPPANTPFSFLHPLYLQLEWVISVIIYRVIKKAGLQIV